MTDDVMFCVPPSRKRRGHFSRIPDECNETEQHVQQSCLECESADRFRWLQHEWSSRRACTASHTGDVVHTHWTGATKVQRGKGSMNLQQQSLLQICAPSLQLEIPRFATQL